MDYTGWLLLKFGALVLAAFVYGFWRGINGLRLTPEQTDTAAEEGCYRPAAKD